MRPPARRSMRGFTLVELLVAITILALFMTASMGAVRIGSRSWIAGHERTDTTEEMRASADFLRRQFAQAPVLAVGEGDRESLVFLAEEERLMFVAPAPHYSAGAGLMTYLLAVETIEDGEALTLRYGPFDPGSEHIELPPDARRLVLVRDLAHAGFEYFGAAGRQDRAHWRPAWPRDAEWLPEAIRIRTRAEDGTGGWPDLVLPLRSGGGA